MKSFAHIAVGIALVGTGVGAQAQSSALALGAAVPGVEEVVAQVLGATSAISPRPAGGVATTSTCAGNCNGDTAVTVDEVLTLVNIALGNLGVATCRAGDVNGDSQITVDEILAAVNSALNGCSSSSNVSGTWTSSGAVLVSSDCGLVFDTVVEYLLGLQAPCTFQVSQAGSHITIVNCNQVHFDGSVDQSGTINAETSASDISPECSFSTTAGLSVNASHSPTTAMFVFYVDASLSCGFGVEHCTAEFDTTWER